MAEKTFWDNDASVVLLCFSSLANDVTDVVDDVLKTFVTILALLRDDDKVGRCLERALSGQVGRFLTHESDKVPILDGRGAVSKHVTNKLRVDLRGSVESNCCLEVLVVDVAINSGWDVNNADRGALRLEVLS